MFRSLRRIAARIRFRVPLLRSIAFTTTFALSTLCAHAVVVRGHITDAVGHPVPGARVQLIERGKVEAFAYADDKGAFEIRYANGDRFTLLGSALGFLPAQ